jgi:hypothetical protein
MPGEDAPGPDCPHGFICSEVGCKGASPDPSIRINNAPNTSILRCNMPEGKIRRIGSVPAADVMKNPRKYIR